MAQDHANVKLESKDNKAPPSNQPDQLAFWKRRNWTRDSILSITAEALLGLPYAILFADDDAKKEE